MTETTEVRAKRLIKHAAEMTARASEIRVERLKRAAELSRTKTATTIMSELRISKRTLKRYMADPLWEEYGGASLTFTERGRPTRNGLSSAEKQTLAEAYRLHNQGLQWVAVAAELGIEIDQLRYLRRKDAAV